MNIREYSKNDYGGVLSVYANSKLDELNFESVEFELLALDKDKIRSAQILDSEVFVYGDVEIIAFCAISGSEIRALFVQPRARGKGVGIKLLEFMLAKINGAATLYVAASNFPAIGLYQKYGFVIRSEFKTTYNKVNVLANKMERLPVYC